MQDPGAAQKTGLIGTHQRRRIVLPGQRAGRHVTNYRSFSRVAVRDIEIHQAAVFLADGRTVFPAHTDIQCKTRSDPPIVGHAGVVDIAAEVLVGVTESDRTGIGNTQQEVAEVSTRSQARKAEASPRVGLGKRIELLPPVIDDESEVMRRTNEIAGQSPTLSGSC